VLSTTPTLVSAMVLGAIFLQIHAPSLFLCRILSMSCVAHQLRGHILMPMSCLFWCLAWAYPCFPPKQKVRMKKRLMYKKTTYTLGVYETPARLRKWDEVMNYLKHLPEFVNEVFDEQQMKNIQGDFWNYVTHDFVGPMRLHIQKSIKDNNCT